MSSNESPLSERLRAAWNQAPHLPLSDVALTALRARLAAEAAPAKELAKISSRTRPLWAIAASVVLVIGLGAGVQVWRTSLRLSDLSALAAGDHQNCAIKFALTETPISLAEAATRYDPAFGRLQNVVFAETIAAAPIRVLERHACVFRGRPFAHIVLNYRDSIVSVLVADDGAVGSEWWRGIAAREMPASGGYHVASFRTSQHIVFVVSALPAADINRLAAALVTPMSSALAGA